MIRLTAVQRVGYRAKVVSLAKNMGLVGFIQNRPDGRVIVIAEGEKKEDLEKFASDIKIKNALINAENISAEYSPGSGEYEIFRKITGPDEVGERLDDGIEILKNLVVGVNNLAIGINGVAVGLNNLTTITKEGFENLGGKMDRMLDKQDLTISILSGVDSKMDQMLDKQDQTLGKMDQMLNKQDQMIDKQDQTISILSGMDEKMDHALDKQDETTEAVRDLKRDDERFVRMEKDIRTIKGKLGIR